MFLGSILLHASLRHTGPKNKSVGLFVHTGFADAYCNTLYKTEAKVSKLCVITKSHLIFINYYLFTYQVLITSPPLPSALPLIYIIIINDNNVTRLLRSIYSSLIYLVCCNERKQILCARINLYSCSFVLCVKVLIRGPFIDLGIGAIPVHSSRQLLNTGIAPEN